MHSKPTQHDNDCEQAGSVADTHLYNINRSSAPNQSFATVVKSHIAATFAHHRQRTSFGRRQRRRGNAVQDSERTLPSIEYRDLLVTLCTKVCWRQMQAEGQPTVRHRSNTHVRRRQDSLRSVTHCHPVRSACFHSTLYASLNRHQSSVKYLTSMRCPSDFDHNAFIHSSAQDRNLHVHSRPRRRASQT